MKHTTVLLSLLALALAGVAPADSLNVRRIGGCDTPGNAFGVAVSGDYAYVADGDSGLRIISIADPSQPVEVGSLVTPDSAYDVAVVGDYAYVADDTAGLRVISIADPAHPVEVGSCAIPGQALGLSIVGDRAYVAASGLRIISIADPAHPFELGYCDSIGSARDVDVSGNYAYVAVGELRVISVSDSAHPVEVGFCPGLGFEFNGVAVSGWYAYGADDFGHLEVIRVADPSEPIEIAHLTLSVEHPYGVAVGGGFAYVTADGGLLVGSVSDPAHPTGAGYYKMGSRAYGVTLAGDSAYVAHGTAGLQIFEFYGGGGVEEAINDERETMSSGTSVVRGVLVLGAVDSRQNTGYRAELIDANGRKVTELHAGANEVGRLAPGVYFVRERSAVTKVLVTR
jgi:hypothetical protein